MPEPDLFVVCKNCSAEVSPYVTECPYCGQRVRKRAPKIGPDGAPQERRIRRKPPRLPKLRPNEIPGIASEAPPYATGLLIALGVVALIAIRAVTFSDLGALYEPETDWWRAFTTPFVHENFAHAFVTLTATGIFGMHLERRFGRLVPVAVFVAAGAAGATLASAADALPAIGANGAALGMLCAWLVEDRLAARRGQDRGNDLLGVYVIAGLLVALSLATEEASLVAALGGALTGSAAGLLLSSVKR